VLDPLPIDRFVPEIVDRLRRFRALVVTAQPGAGKTTRVPPALIDDDQGNAGPLILLQPRRVAARAIAQRIATERGWRVGEEIGWQIRLERRFGPRTKLLVATEGVLTARLQQDPLLSSFRTIVLDEFHERSIHADLAIALAKQAWLARDDLRIVVMSATLDSGAVSAYLNGCPVIDVPGRLYPIDVEYTPGASMPDAVAEAMRASHGDVLCFLPGAFEIRRAIDEMHARRLSNDADLVPLHGSLDADAQDLALRPAATASSRRRVIVATNIAETSVTVPGVTAVVDSGFHKVARYDPDRGIDSLDVERITADAADQRAGRAGRTGPGIVRRLWDARDRLRPHREPEIFRIDLSSTALDVIAWGGDPRRLEWFEAPSSDAVDAALALLARLGAVQGGALTDIGRAMQRLPLHPRLARMLVASNGARQMARACALLSERHMLPPRTATTTSDLLSALDRWSDVPPHVQRVAREVEQLASSPESRAPAPDSIREMEFRRAVLAGYPDRVAQRREPHSPKLRLASGAGAVVAPQSGVTGGEFLVALDVHASSRPDDPDARVRLASLVDREWLQATRVDVVHRFDEARGVVKAVEVERYDGLVLAERAVDADPQERANILAEAWGKRGPRAVDAQLLRRLRFAGVEIDADQLVRRAAVGARALDDIDLASSLSFEERQLVDRNAPEAIQVPSGRTARLEYEEDGTVTASVKLQELFGLADTPRIGPRKEPVRLALLAPNGRPVQTTRDLRSFWNTTYAEVRKELRGRYPKHPWPEDPWTATPTSRTSRKAVHRPETRNSRTPRGRR
jgi:ATP-dependent RNA helicase HrpB